MDIQPNNMQTSASKHKKNRSGNLELAAFCDQMAMIVASGLPTYEGISILMTDAPDEETKQILSTIYQPLEAGSSFHDALEEAGIFPKYALELIKIGELSGRLDDVLYSLKDYYEREDSIRSGIKSAVTYPIIMIGIMLAVIFVLIGKVLPVFNQIYSELGAGLSGFALAMMNLSLNLNKYLFVIIGFLVLLLIAGIFLWKSDTGRILFQGRRLSLSIAAGRFANCMAMTLSSGFDTNQGLELALSLVENPHMEERIRRCKEYCESGKSFSESLLTAGIFDKIYASMITIASRTGAMDQMMKRISDEYEKDIDRQISHFLSILEPALIILLAVVVGMILIAFLLPLVGIMSSIG